MTKRYPETQASVYQFPLPPHQMRMFKGRYSSPSLPQMDPAAHRCVCSLKSDFRLLVAGSRLGKVGARYCCNTQHIWLLLQGSASGFCAESGVSSFTAVPCSRVVTSLNCYLFQSNWKSLLKRYVQPFPGNGESKLCWKNTYRALSWQALLILCFYQHLDLYKNNKTKQ